MPLYEYECKNCGQVFDKLLPSRLADSPVRCPRCQSDQTEKQISSFSSGGCGTASGRFR